MRRREFITILGGAAAACPLAARGQQPMPVVGFLEIRAVGDTDTTRTAAFAQGLNETGFFDGRNVIVDIRTADNLDELPALATDLVRRKVAAIFGSAPAAISARKATAAIPIVFATAGDPVAEGLVSSLNRPGGNVTGVRVRAGDEPTKMLELMHELVPRATTIGVLINPAFPSAEHDATKVAAAGHSLGLAVIIVRAKLENEFEAAFASLAQAGAGAVLVLDTRYFDTRRVQIVAMAARYSIPAASQPYEFAVAGGLFSYGASINEAIRQGGVYVGQILKGERPADLPVLQPMKFELVINLKAAKALILDVPEALLARADEVIE